MSLREHLQWEDKEQQERIKEAGGSFAMIARKKAETPDVPLPDPEVASWFEKEATYGKILIETRGRKRLRYLPPSEDYRFDPREAERIAEWKAAEEGTLP